MIEEGFVSVAPFLKPFSSNDEGLLLENEQFMHLCKPDPITS
jgi:hypothetical protein